MNNKVGEVFKRVSDKYDIMNDIMSVGLHRYWKNEMISILNPVPGMNLIDVAGGTGKSTNKFYSFLYFISFFFFKIKKVILLKDF